MATIAEELAAAAVTDSFLRNENPLSNEGKWTKPSWCTVIGKCVLSTGWQGSTGFVSGSDGARWGSSFASGAVDHIYSMLTLSKYSSAQLAERWWATWACLPAANQDGYRVKAEYVSGVKYKIKLEKVTGGTAEVLGEKEVELSADTSHPAIAIVVGNGTAYAYTRKEEGAEWVEQVKVADVTYTEGRSGVELRGNYFEGRNFRTGTFEIGEEEGEEGVVKPEPASATASVGSDVVANVIAGVGDATASMPNSELVGGAMQSPTDHKRGLPLPFPSILANPSRVGPPRFSAADRKALGLD